MQEVDWWVASQIKQFKTWIREVPITGMMSIHSDINHSPIIPDWLAKSELKKYVPEKTRIHMMSQPKKLGLQASSLSTNTTIIISIVVVIGALLIAGITTAVVVTRKKK